MRAFLATLMILGTGACLASAREIRPVVPPSPMAPQFLFVKLLPPDGWTASLPADTGNHPGVGGETLGLRPGYPYRARLSHAGTDALYPTIEVLGSPMMPPDGRPERHVAVIAWTGDELSLAASGKLVTKILYIEDPKQAAPVATSPESPITIVAEPGQDILAMARGKGRPVAMVTIGSRSIEADEWAWSAVPGTVWRVGREAPSPPASPPTIPLPMIPPTAMQSPAGPRLEIVRDGGDRYPRAAMGTQAVGIDTEDTVAEFTGSKGSRRIIPSNNITLYTPRFCWITQLSGIGRVDHQTGPAGTAMSTSTHRVGARQPSLATVSETRINGVRSRSRPGGLDLTQYAGRVVKLQLLMGQDLVQTPISNVVGTGPDSVNDRSRPQATIARESLITRSGQVGIHQLMTEARTMAVAMVEPGSTVVSSQAVVREARSDQKEEMVVLDQPMVLHKSADKQVAIPGEVVTFTLRFSNMTGKPLRDVAIVDNLAPRLEYLEGSARSNKEAVFTVQENAEGSLILRWEVGTLAPGENALVKFQAKVR